MQISYDSSAPKWITILLCEAQVKLVSTRLRNVQQPAAVNMCICRPNPRLVYPTHTIPIALKPSASVRLVPGRNGLRSGDDGSNAPDHDWSE